MFQLHISMNTFELAESSNFLQVKRDRKNKLMTAIHILVTNLVRTGILAITTDFSRKLQRMLHDLWLLSVFKIDKVVPLHFFSTTYFFVSRYVVYHLLLNYPLCIPEIGSSNINKMVQNMCF